MYKRIMLVNGMNTNELPISPLGGGDDDGCLTNFVGAAVLVLFVVFLIYTCSGDAKQEQKSEPPKVSAPSPVYEQPRYIVPPSAEVPKNNSVQEQKHEVEVPAEQPAPLPTVHVSKYYEKGYDAGYDDGEDDAVMDNGWGGQFDDSCPYKGKARKDYQLGYEEGYEAGYYDNKDSDD